MVLLAHKYLSVMKKPLDNLFPSSLLWSYTGEAAEAVTEAELAVILTVGVHCALAHAGQAFRLHLKYILVCKNAADAMTDIHRLRSI
jgi:hypothetical protein